MPSFDLVVVALNMLGAGAALACNLWAARHGSGLMRSTRTMVAWVAGLYVVAYGWLLIHQDVVLWSRVMRGVALVVWPTVWCIPAIVSVVATRKIIARIEDLADPTSDTL